MKTLAETLDDEVQKALEWDIADPLEVWHKNAIYTKARRCADEICRLAFYP